MVEHGRTACATDGNRLVTRELREESGTAHREGVRRRAGRRGEHTNLTVAREALEHWRDVRRVVSRERRELMQAQLCGCQPDVLLQPDVGQVGLFAFDLAPLAYSAGLAAAEARLPALHAAAQGAPA